MTAAIDDDALGTMAACALLPAGVADWAFWIRKALKEGGADFETDSPASVAHTAARLWRVATGATAADWIDELQDIANPAPSLFVRAGELTRLPAKIDWLIKSIFERDTVGLLFGDPGTFKSFTALGLAACIATDTPWEGNKVTAGPVVYIAGEGHAGVARRLKAWEVHHGISLEDAPLFVSRRAVPMLDGEAIDSLVDEIDALPAPVLIIIDTMARSMAGGEENSAADVGAFVAACDRLRARYKASVLVVHHSGHGDKSRARGSSALRAAVDLEMSMARTPDAEDVLTLACSKSKDSEPFPPLHFVLQPVDLPWADEDGNPINSAVLVQTDFEPSDRPAKPKGKHQTAAIDTLRQLLAQYRARLEESGLPATQARVTLGDWKEAMREAGIDRRRVHQVVETLIKSGQVKQDGTHVHPAA